MSAPPEVFVLMDHAAYEGHELIGVFATLEAAQADAAEVWGSEWEAAGWQQPFGDTWHAKFAKSSRWTVIRREGVQS